MEDAIATATAAASRSNNIMEDNPDICKKLSTMVSNFSVDDMWKNKVEHEEKYIRGVSLTAK